MLLSLLQSNHDEVLRIFSSPIGLWYELITLKINQSILGPSHVTYLRIRSWSPQYLLLDRFTNIIWLIVKQLTLLSSDHVADGRYSAYTNSLSKRNSLLISAESAHIRNINLGFATLGIPGFNNLF